MERGMRGLLAIGLCLLLTGCASAQASQPREDVKLDAREATYEPPAEEVAGEPITGDLSAEESETLPDTAEPTETWLETDENALYGEIEWGYGDGDYGYCEPCYEPSYAGGSTATTLGDLLNGQGRAVDDNGTNFTWYYHDLGNGALDIPGETFDEDGVSHDGDGYIVVATDAYEKGTVIDTPYGEARVWDSGCGSTIDVYTTR